MSADLQVEVVFADANSQRLKTVGLPAGATVENAIAASGLQSEFPDYDFRDLPVGIWGKVVQPQRKVRAGDRVEIYRGLEVDPMEARRIRASATDPGPS